MKIELGDNAAWTILVVSFIIMFVVILVNVLGYYRLKAEKLTEMVKAGANPVVVRCALYQSCPATGRIVIEEQP